MTSISGVNSAALILLQQTSSIGATEEEKTGTDNLVAVANGVSEKIGMVAQPGQAESRISEAMFSVNNVNINELKIKLIERAGEELGFDRNDYESDAQFSAAMRKQVLFMIADGADARITEIEKELGLDKLGVSLLDVVSSARNPDLDDKVTQALEAREGVEDEEEKKAEEEAVASLAGTPDEIGLYGNLSA